MELDEVVSGLRPDDGEYSLVEIETGGTVAEAGHVLVEFDDADEVTIPPDTDFETYAAYDREGNIYTRESWPEPASRAPDDGPEQKASLLPGWMAGGSTNY
jgi:hypothetical protein